MDYKRILIELKQIEKQIINLVEEGSWDVLDEILLLIKIFGDNIKSNGIRTDDDISKLRAIKSENLSLFVQNLYQNLCLLITEYEQLVQFETKHSLVSDFKFLHSDMTLVKNEDNNHFFINETNEEWIVLSEKIPLETEAVILIGYGSGILYSQLTNNYHVLAVDPFELLVPVKSDGVMSFLTKDNKTILHKKLDTFIGLKTEIILHPLYEHSQQVIELLKTVRDLLQEDSINLNTRVLYTEKWYREALLNTIYLKNNKDKILNIENLRNKYKGSKALMVAGGPSLEEALPYLKKSQNSYYIVAIGQTVKALLKHNIIPDFIVSIDAGEANAFFFENIELDIPLVYSLQVNHQIPQRTTGPLIPYVDTPLSQEVLTHSTTVFNSAPTVAISAVSFMNFLGFDTIGLIGQDLALQKGEYYSPSVKTTSSNDGQLTSTLYDIKLNNGEIGKTTPILMNFLNSYELLLKMLPELSSKLVNYAELGAKIDAVTYKPLNSLEIPPITKMDIRTEMTLEAIEIPIDNLKNIFKTVYSNMQVVDKHLKRIVKQKAVTIDEFEKVLRHWDDMIESPNFRTHAMPLQLVNLMIIQNKIKLHNRCRRTNSTRLMILNLMNQTIQKLSEQMKEFILIAEESNAKFDSINI